MQHLHLSHRILKAKPGKKWDLQRALLDVAGPTRKQPGNVSFSVCRSQDETTILIGFERWASAAAHDQHLN